MTVMELAGQKILVTGATGFIGGHLARRLLSERVAAVRALVRDEGRAEGLAKLGAELAVGDLGNAASLEGAARGCSVVVHLAAQVSAVPNRETFVRANRTGTENVLRAAVRAGVGRFLHLSSIAVFGLVSSGQVTDSNPRGYCGDPYCDTKFEAEEIVRRYGREQRLPVAILRPSAVYGPGSTHWSVIPLKRIKKGKMFLVDGGQGMLNYVYIDNVVDAILLAMKDDRAVGEAFIVNDGATTWCEFFTAYARMTGRDRLSSLPFWAAKLWVRYRNLVSALKKDSARVPPNALSFLVGTAVYEQTHIEEKLGHRSRVDLREGMRRTEAWFRETGLL